MSDFALGYCVGFFVAAVAAIAGAVAARGKP